jgi:hypothetical protein
MTKAMTFQEFLSFFPEVDLPITLSDEYLEIFSRNNKVLPGEAIHRYIYQWETKDDDETTEFIPCLALPPQDEFIGLIYWKANVEKFEYILVTLGKTGNLISRKPIASITYEGKLIKRSVASIDEDLIIHIIAGAHIEGVEYDPEASQAFNMEILPTGDVLFSLDN